MNITPLRKTIAKESLIFAIMLAFIAALVVVISIFHDDYMVERSKEFSATQQLLSEKQGLEDKYTKLQNNLELFHESQQHAKTQGLFLASDAIGSVLGNYQNHLLLSKLSVNASSIADIANNPKYLRMHYVVNQSTVKLDLGALSDEDVYILMRAIASELPGFVKYTSLTLEKKIEPHKEILNQIKRSGATSLVEGQLTFDWYGLKSTKPNDPFNHYIPPAPPQEGAAP